MEARIFAVDWDEDEDFDYFHFTERPPCLTYPQLRY